VVQVFLHPWRLFVTEQTDSQRLQRGFHMHWWLAWFRVFFDLHLLRVVWPSIYRAVQVWKEVGTAFKLNRLEHGWIGFVRVTCFVSLFRLLVLLRLTVLISLLRRFEDLGARFALVGRLHRNWNFTCGHRCFLLIENGLRNWHQICKQSFGVVNVEFTGLVQFEGRHIGEAQSTRLTNNFLWLVLLLQVLLQLTHLPVLACHLDS